ncbi:T9SS type A sorting domain-containing protein [Polaribacter porphyrae]|uniref:T9SS type A sorting domain-containing protein n=1 Tax=Polaribacter porphyrae TaxID=1137780 RepID=UPI0014761B93|nr:T9SS type A sorting domain-containing protein [Polaribacter porphyrae]
MKIKFPFLIILFTYFSINCSSQNTNGDLEDYIDAIIKNIPGSSGDDYKSPSITQSNIWENSLDYVLTNDIPNARLQLGKIGYKITEFLDNSTNQTFYILEKNSNSSNHWGTYIFTKNSVINNLIITAPHVLNDTNTGQQAVYCLKNTLAKAVFLNGTERCNSSSFSSCSGTTSTCDNGSEPFRISDVAHSEEAIFHLSTKILHEKIANSIFIQLHGFGKTADDPSVILSNGTRTTPTIDYIDLLKNELLIEDSSLTFKIPHKDLSWNRLIAFTNTQGRLINGSSQPCNTHFSSASGRFISLEQEREKLRNNVSGWQKVSNAIDRVFTKALNLTTENINNNLIYPNPSKGKISFKLKEIGNIKVYNLLGKEVEFTENYSSNSTTFSIKIEQEGIYYIKVSTKEKAFFQKVIILK